MTHSSYRRLRVEPLEDRALPAVVINSIHLDVNSPASTFGSEVLASHNADSPTSPAENESETDPDADEYGKNGQETGGPTGGTPSPSSPGGGNEKPPAAEHGTTLKSSGESPDEYNSTENASSKVRYQNPYFYGGSSYPVIAIPAPPGPALPSPVAVAPSAPEDRTESHPELTNSVLVADDQTAPPTLRPSAAPGSESPAGPLDEMQEEPDDLPRVDEQGAPATASETPDEPAQAPGPTPASLLDELSVRVNVADWERAATQLLDGLDRVLLDVTDSESPVVRISYWIGAAAATGLAIELTRNGLRAKRPTLAFSNTAFAPVNR